MTLTEGVVIRAGNGMYTVQSNGHLVHCRLRGNLKKHFEYSISLSNSRRVTRAKRPHVADAIAVGDNVRFAETQHGAGVIEEILPRRSRFARQGFRGREQTVVSNLDQLMIVFACAEPRLDPWKLDRFLVAAEAAEIEPVIVLNKRDLVDVDELNRLIEPISELGYKIISTSARDERGVEPLRDALKDKISAFVGPSGVGKSSLLNSVQPGLNLQTSDIGYVTFKGKHTTTSSQLIPLLFGGWVADTPGLRNLDLLELGFDDLVECFPELRAHVGNCKFDDCRHESEPGCAIKAAVDSGSVQRRRYESLLVLAGETKTK